MKESKGLVSIVIPAYNAENFISETMDSVLRQEYTNMEIWVINDGSTDTTVQKVNAIRDERIRLVNQENSGVSVARNKGLGLSNGEFIMFFDADDLMTPEFLNVRVDALYKNSNIGFVGGVVENFPIKKQIRRAVAEDPEKEIHFFDPHAATVPSNYLFRASVIKENNILFNTSLNSSADRFFLLEIAKCAKGKSLPGETGKLLYRVSEKSMSNHITPKLILDYNKFYSELNSKNLLPRQKRREIKSRYLFSLASGFSLVRYWKSSFSLLCRSFITQPFIFFKLAAQKIFSAPRKPK